MAATATAGALNAKGPHAWINRGRHRENTTTAPALLPYTCDLASGADRLFRSLLLHAERPLEEGRGSGLGPAAAPGALFSREELRPGEQ